MSKGDESLWKLIEVKGAQVEDNIAVVAISLLSEGQNYVVAVSGGKDMTTNNVVNALRAGLAHYANANGMKLQIEGARDATKAETAAHKRGLN